VGLRYPIYIPSKGRADKCLTARALRAEETPFTIVVEEQEREAYGAIYGDECLAVLPFRDQGLVPVRNWIKEHATANGHYRHWQLDDDLTCLRQCTKAGREKRAFKQLLPASEDFVDRYSNVAIAGLKSSAYGHQTKVPFKTNQQVYCCVLVLNELPYQWRGKQGEDTDFSLQVLAGGWCTVLFEAFQFDAASTGSMSGGNTDGYGGDGRIERARELQHRWPKLVRLQHRYGRPGFDCGHIWRKFDTPLVRKAT
jgi:hypothetical protein